MWTSSFYNQIFSSLFQSKCFRRCQKFTCFHGLYRITLTIFTWPYSQMMGIRQASSVRFWILTLIFIYTYISYGVIQNNIVIWFVMVCLFWLFHFFHLHVHFLKNLTLIPSIRFWQSFTNCAQIIQGKVKILNNDLVHFKFF